MATTTDIRPELRKAYLHVVNNWAVSTRDVAEKVFNGDTKAAGSALRLLGSLVEGTHVNGERELTWQSYYDIENSDPKETLAKARADFKAAFPKPITPGSTDRKGATGPRYTDAQINAGLKARHAGKKNAEVAAAAGVKSPAYFAKTLKKIEAESAKAKKTTRRTVKRSSKKTAPITGATVLKGARAAAKK